MNAVVQSEPAPAITSPPLRGFAGSMCSATVFEAASTRWRKPDGVRTQTFVAVDMNGAFDARIEVGEPCHRLERLEVDAHEAAGRAHPQGVVGLADAVGRLVEVELTLDRRALRIDRDDLAVARAERPDRAPPEPSSSHGTGSLTVAPTRTVFVSMPTRRSPSPESTQIFPLAKGSRPESKVLPTGIDLVTFSRFGSIRTMSLPEHDQTAPPPEPIPWHSCSLFVSARTSPFGLLVARVDPGDDPVVALHPDVAAVEGQPVRAAGAAIDASWAFAMGVVRSALVGDENCSLVRRSVAPASVSPTAVSSPSPPQAAVAASASRQQESTALRMSHLLFDDDDARSTSPARSGLTSGLSAA